MRRWIVFGCGAIGLGAAAWHFGRPTNPPASAPPTQASSEVAQAATPKELTPRVIEVIDLARAYEPVPEPEEVLPGGVDPASFIQVPDRPERIPPAIDVDNSYADVIRTVREAPSGWFFWGEPDRERIDVMPRELHDNTVWVEFPAGDYQLVPRAAILDANLDKPPTAEARTGREKWLVEEADGSLRSPRFIPRGVPYPPEFEKWLPQSDSVSQFIPVEPLKVMPRVVDATDQARPHSPFADIIRIISIPSGPFLLESSAQEILDVMPRELK
jgi:hypothetical protein